MCIINNATILLAATPTVNEDIYYDAYRKRNQATIGS